MNPPRNRKGGAGNPPPKGARASALPDMIEWSSPTGGYREQSRQTSDARLRRESIVEGQDPVYTVRLHDSQVQAVPR